MEKRKSAVALGLFDGIHLGHRAVLNMALEKEKNDLIPYVFTFNPTMVLKKSKGEYGYIYTHFDKLDILCRLGFLGHIYSVSFQEVCGLSGEEFVKNILIDKLNTGFVCCGNDFRFGKNASCGVSELYALGRKYGFDVCIADDVVYEGETVSSTAIRNMLQNGDVVRAWQFLGEPYTINKTVIHGAELGRTIGFPTINQLFNKGQLVLKYGVYASDVCIDGVCYRAMTNIGMKPTVNYNGIPLAETHIIDFSGDLYGRRIQTNIREFIRPEQKFDSVGELQRQIAKDMKDIQHINIENS
ncbi:MAG: riboflavin biosynthesis protein RibF [Ruminococcus sp.]|nr:riboflavin biosynthesis protein RibF [Ruminococcus sp.]